VATRFAVPAGAKAAGRGTAPGTLGRREKLRFRDKAGRQRVRYLGVDLELARKVGKELHARQQAVRRHRKSKHRTRRGAEFLRAAKRRLAPAVDAVGWHFHGHRPRKRRTADGGLPRIRSTNPALPRGVFDKNDTQTYSPIEGDGRRQPGRTPVENFQRWAAAQPHPARVAFFFAAGQLLEFSTVLSEGIKADLADSPNPLAIVEERAPELEMMLKLMRQSDRMMNVASRLKDADGAAEAKKLQLDTYAEPVELDGSPPRASALSAEAAVSAQ